MKKTIILTAIFAMAFAALAMAKPVNAIGVSMTAKATPAYTAYYAARKEAQICDRTGDTACAVAKFLEAESAALAQEAAKTPGDTVDWTACADWQRNNAGYCLILKYQAMFKQNMLDQELLKEAIDILTARKVTTADPASKIEKNLKFCRTQLGI